MPNGNAKLRRGDRVPREIADAHVTDASGERVRVGALWDRCPCLLVLLRHFGCVGCAEQVRDLGPRLFELARVGVRTVLVGSGTRMQERTFVARNVLGAAPVEVMTDPSLELYRAMGLVRSVWSTLGPRALVEMARAMAAGQPHRPVEGDPIQQGGVLLVDGAGNVRLFHASRSIADHPPASDLVETSLKLAVETSRPAADIV